MLALTVGDQFYGIVGTKTAGKCGRTTVCIGDTIEVADSTHGAYNGVVVMIGHIVTIAGAGYRSVETMQISRILNSHKELQEGGKVPRTGICVMKVKGLKE